MLQEILISQFVCCSHLFKQVAYQTKFTLQHLLQDPSLTIPTSPELLCLEL